MTYYVFVLGSYDQVFVGPFANEEAADTWKNANAQQFDRYVLTEDEMKENVAEFGELPVQSP